MTAGELEMLDLSYAPPYSGVYDPLLICATNRQARTRDCARRRRAAGSGSDRR
jgi:hypothetical protein